MSIVATTKGKGKADDSRRPLLSNERDAENDYGSTSQSLRGGVLPSQDAVASSFSHRAIWKSYLLTGALTFLSILFIIAFAIILLAHSYAAPALHNIHEALSSESDTFWKAATIVRGPDNIKVVALERTKVEEGQEILEANVTVTMRLAVDTDFIMGFQDANKDTWFREKWKQLGRWAVRKLGVVTAFIDDFALYPSNASLAGVSPMVTIKPHGPISIPLYPGLTELAHRHPPSLQPILLNLTVYPSQNVSLMLDFFKETWFAGFASIKIRTTNLSLHGGGPSKVAVRWWQFGLWRSWLKFSTSNLIAFLKIKSKSFCRISFDSLPYF